VEIAQVLGNLGTSVNKNVSRSEEHQEPTSPSNPIMDLPNIEMPFLEDETHLETHIEVRHHVEQIENT